MLEETTSDVGTDRIHTRASCLDRLYTVTVKTCGGDDDLATEVLEKISADGLQTDYTTLVREVLLACQRILREELMLEESNIPEAFWDDFDVQTYLAHRMQTAEAEFATGKTVSLKALIEERNRNESF